MSKKALFIINPASGTQRKTPIVTQIHAFASSDWLDYAIVYTEAPGHATQLARQAAEAGWDYVVAVGGDGTVNEAGTGLLHSDTALGILPVGSGNGLARHLGIPLQTMEALKRVRRGKVATIDSAQLDGRPFFCTSGAGIDAAVSQAFAKADGRGFQTYVRTSLQQLRQYVPQSYQIETDHGQFETTALLMTVANASQFGNDAFIAPRASTEDGLLDLCWVRPQPWLYYPISAWQLFRRSLHQNPYWQTQQTRRVRIRRAGIGAVHLDGDPMEGGLLLDYQVVPQSLRVLV
ncbi:MAG: diacylglycerol/lipid kinase family protein [Bernardetiaceae bacterium]